MTRSGLVVAILYFLLIDSSLLGTFVSDEIAFLTAAALQVFKVPQTFLFPSTCARAREGLCLASRFSLECKEEGGNCFLESPGTALDLLRRLASFFLFEPSVRHTTSDQLSVSTETAADFDSRAARSSATSVLRAANSECSWPTVARCSD